MSSFTFVKLIIHSVLLVSCAYQSFANGGKGSENFFVQINASETSPGKQQQSLKHNIHKSTDELYSGHENHYYAGKFDNKENDRPVSEKQLRESDTTLIPYDLTDPRVQMVVSDSIDDTPAGSTYFVSDLPTGNYSENFILRMFFNDSEISVFQWKLIDFGKENIPQPFRRLYNQTIDNIFENPAVLFFFFLILFFILNIIGVFLLLSYTIKRKNRKEKFLGIFSKMYEEVLISYMFGLIDWPAASEKLKRKGKKENRKVLISILLNFKENFRGDVEKFFPEIYMKLGLQNDSLKAAHSSRNFTKIQGILELTHLYPDGAKDIVKDLINAKNDYVRSEAQIAFIRLNTKEPFKFFENLTKPFTRWTQISAFNLIRIYQLPVPSFADHLERQHINIRNFSLRMIVYFQQLENIPEILRMVESERELTRFLSYEAINLLRIYEGRELIKNKYWEEKEKNKIEIIKAFRNIGIEDDLEFLERIILSEPVSFKTEACRSLYYMSQSGKNKLDQMNNNAVQGIEQLIAHVTDPRN